MNKTEEKELLEASDSAFEKARTKAAKELDAAKERARKFAEINDLRAAKAQVEAMDPAERARLAQFISVEGVDASGEVNGG